MSLSGLPAAPTSTQPLRTWETRSDRATPLQSTDAQCTRAILGKQKQEVNWHAQSRAANGGRAARADLEGAHSF